MSGIPFLDFIPKGSSEGELNLRPFVHAFGYQFKYSVDGLLNKIIKSAVQSVF